MAVKFRFRLEAVEGIRRRERDARRRAVADAVREVQRAEEMMVSLKQQLTETIHSIRRAQSSSRPDMVSLRQHQFYRGELHRRIVESEQELANRQAVLEVERGKLAEASKRLKVIEKLRERHWNRYVEQTRREEQRAMDEAALQRYSRAELTESGMATP